MNGFIMRALTGRSPLQKMLGKHFNGLPVTSIVTAAREFPVTSRVDVQLALEQLFQTIPPQSCSPFTPSTAMRL